MVSAAEAIAQASGLLNSLDGQATADAAYNDAKWGDPRSVNYGYWRKPDGTLTFHQNGHNTLDLLQRGWVMLPSYGVDQLTAGRRDWNPSRDPWRMLVDRGGIKEMPLAQLRTLRFHRRARRNDTASHRVLWERVDQLMRTQALDEPTAVEEVLPQLRGTDWRDWEDFACEMCPGRSPFNAEGDLKRHQSVMHREDVRETVMQKAISGALEKSGELTAGANSEVLQMLAQSLALLAEQSKEDRAAIKTLLETVTGNREREHKAK